MNEVKAIETKRNENGAIIEFTLECGKHGHGCVFVEYHCGSTPNEFGRPQFFGYACACVDDAEHGAYTLAGIVTSAEQIPAHDNADPRATVRAFGMGLLAALAEEARHTKNRLAAMDYEEAIALAAKLVTY